MKDNVRNSLISHELLQPLNRNWTWCRKIRNAVVDMTVCLRWTLDFRVFQVHTSYMRLWIYRRRYKILNGNRVVVKSYSHIESAQIEYIHTFSTPCFTVNNIFFLSAKHIVNLKPYSLTVMPTRFTTRKCLGML